VSTAFPLDVAIATTAMLLLSMTASARTSIRLRFQNCARGILTLFLSVSSPKVIGEIKSTLGKELLYAENTSVTAVTSKYLGYNRRFYRESGSFQQ
jgi:hypothetical protein